MYAIIETGGKQYKVKEGDVIKVEKLGLEADEDYTFENVVLLGGEGGLAVGSPFVPGVSVAASVMGDGKEKKVIIYKFKSKKGFHKKKGHRQPFTRLKINKISTGEDDDQEIDTGEIASEAIDSKEIDAGEIASDAAASGAGE